MSFLLDECGLRTELEETLRNIFQAPSEGDIRKYTPIKGIYAALEGEDKSLFYIEMDVIALQYFHDKWVLTYLYVDNMGVFDTPVELSNFVGWYKGAESNAPRTRAEFEIPKMFD